MAKAQLNPQIYFMQASHLAGSVLRVAKSLPQVFGAQGVSYLLMPDASLMPAKARLLSVSLW